MQPHIESRGAIACFSSAGLAEGTNAGTIQIAAPNGAGIDYAIDGLGYHKADADNIDLTADDAIADGYTAIILIQINASGTVSSVLGDSVDNDDLTAGTAVLHWPRPSADNCPIGAVKVACDGASFTPGTTDLGAANITDTYYNFIGGMPHEPLTS